MKEVSQTLGAHLNTEKSFRSCDLYEIHFRSGLSYYYADTDYPVQFGGHIYITNGPIITRTAIKTNSMVSVDKLTLTINANERDTLGGVPLIAVAHNGGFDGAKLQLRRAFFGDNGQVLDVIDLFKGTCEVKNGGGLSVQLEVKSVVQALNTEWPNRRYYPQCPYSLYSKECGVNVGDYRKRVSVTAVTAHNTVQFNTEFADGYYKAGGIEWISGNLVGQVTQIVESVHNTVAFMTPSEVQPSIGDEAYIYPGCDKTPGTCRAKFNNFRHNRATPYVPLKETIR